MYDLFLQALTLLLLSHLAWAEEGVARQMIPLKVPDRVCLAKEGKPSPWGHLYVDGAVEMVEFFTSEFSTLFPCEPVELTEAVPEDACDPLENAADIEGKIVLVKRGTCTFVEKAENVAAAKGRVVVVYNHDEDHNLLSMPYGSVERNETTLFDKIGSVMISKRSSMLLKTHMRMDEKKLLLVKGEFASDDLGYTFHPCGECAVNTEESPSADVLEGMKRIKKPVKGGIAYVGKGKSVEDLESGLAVDFVVGLQGGSIPVGSVVRLVTLPLDNIYGCSPISNDIPPSSVVFLKRGMCSFQVKQENVYKAGGWSLLVQNSEDTELSLPAVPENSMDPFSSENFAEGSLLATTITFSNSGRRISKFLEENEEVYIRFQATKTSLGKWKDVDMEIIEGLAYWSPENYDNLSTHVEDFIHQVGLNEKEKKRELRGTFVEPQNA